jgi:hypothetical protein
MEDQLEINLNAFIREYKKNKNLLIAKQDVDGLEKLVQMSYLKHLDRFTTGYMNFN